jgi:hypothetical protein
VKSSQIPFTLVESNGGKGLARIPGFVGSSHAAIFAPAVSDGLIHLMSLLIVVKKVDRS